MIKPGTFSPLALAACCLCGITALRAANDPPPFRVNTQLVEVDVVVRGNNGPVANLTKNDFTILDNGKPQEIAVFNVRSAATKGTSKLKPLGPGVVSNRITRSGDEPGNPTVILWDALNTETPDQAWVRNEVIRYLATMRPGDPVAVYILVRNLRVIQDFTDDSAPLILALSRTYAEQSADLLAPSLTDLVGQIANPMLVSPSGGANTMAALQALQNQAVASAGEMTNFALRDQVYITQAALEAIAEHLLGLPGRKKLVWITGGFPVIQQTPRAKVGLSPNEFLDFSPEINHAIRKLNGANVAVYPVDPRGVTSGATQASASLFNTNSGLTGLNDASALAPSSLTAPGIDTMNLLAGGTGGQAFYATNDAAGVMKTVMEDAVVTYRLGFYPSDAKLDGSYHSLSVKVARKGTGVDEVRARKGYFALDATNSVNGHWRDKLTETMQNPLEATQLGLRASALPVEGSSGVYNLEIILDLDGLHLERAQNGRWVGSVALGTTFSPSASTKGGLETIQISLTETRLREAMQKGFRLSRRIVAGTTTGQLHIVLEDAATGAVGSVHVPIGAQ